jgi:hypothetical protein
MSDTPTPPALPQIVSTEETAVDPPNLMPCTVKDQMGHEYRVFAFPEAPFGLMEMLKGFDPDAPPAGQVDAINTILTVSFPPNQAAMLQNLCRMPGGPSLGGMMALFKDMMEGWFRNPFGGLSELPGSDGSMSTESEEQSSTEAETPPPLPPLIG